MTINCKARLIDLSEPKIIGILNITPDSFFDGGKYREPEVILQHVSQLLADGATFIDIGGYSSRPGAAFVSVEQELDRLLPVISLLVEHFPDVLLSVDTFRSEVARQTIQAGAAMINDISAGLLDEQMFEMIARLQVPYIMMHLRGTPQTMQDFTHYDNIAKEVLFYFSDRIAKAREMGINDIIIDPGFGFSKTLEQNYELFHALELFKNTDLPFLVGVSRKSMIYNLLGTDAGNALNGSTVLHTIALQKGASILRVHEVAQAQQALKIVTALNQYNT